VNTGLRRLDLTGREPEAPATRCPVFALRPLRSLRLCGKGPGLPRRFPETPAPAHRTPSSLCDLRGSKSAAVEGTTPVHGRRAAL